MHSAQFCGEATSGNNDPCTDSEPQGQDAHYGRDAQARDGTLTKAGAGEAGFDFTKISNSGAELSATAGLGSGPGDWACTRDNVTGLLWEVKVDNASHLRHKDHAYTWYFADSPDDNPGEAGATTSCANTLASQNGNNHAKIIWAQWRRTGTGTWRSSGTTESGVPTGAHTVEFKAVTNWSTPGNASVSVTAGQTATATGTYTPVRRTVTATADSGGGVTPGSRTVDHGATAAFTVAPDDGYVHGTVGGTCPAGSFSGNIYTTGAIIANCSVSFSFTPTENRPPVARVRERQIFLPNMGGEAELDASLSSDPDGDALFFSWREHRDNPHHGLIPMGADSLSKMRLSLPTPGRYVFSVRVSDGELMSAQADIPSITVYVPGRKGLIGYTNTNDLVRVPDAVVRVHATAEDAEANRNPVDLAVSDSLGRYVLENLDPNDTGVPYHAVVERSGFFDSGILTLNVRRDPGPGDGWENHDINRGYVSISGRVRNAGGADIQGAYVSIVPGTGESGGQQIGSTTNDEGRFTLGAVPKGAWIMQLRAAGYQHEVRDVNVADDMHELVFTMRADSGRGALSGTVFLAGTDRPVPGARVVLGGMEPKTADAQGAFSYSDIPVGDYYLTVSRDGFTPHRLPAVRVRGGDNPALNLFLSYAGQGPTVFGTVTDAETGRAVRLATVGVVGAAGLLIRSDVTDYTGFYQMRDVPVGEQTIRISAPGYQARTVTVNVPAAGMEMDINRLERAANWTAPVRPGRDAPVARVAEEFIFPANLNQGVTLDASPSVGENPRYIWRENPDNPVLNLLPAGTKNEARPQIGGFPTPGIYIYELQVVSDGRRSANTAAIMVFAPGLSGNVHASPSDGVIGLNNVMVRAYAFDRYAEARDFANTGFSGSIQTRGTPPGNFALSTLAPGSYWIVAQAQQGMGYQRYGPVLRRVNHGSASRNVPINMPRQEYRLEGVVTDRQTRAPLENVRIVFSPGSLSETYRTSTDADGFYRLPVVPGGSAQPMLLMREGYRAEVRTLDISGDATWNDNLEPDTSARPATLSGRVIALFQDTIELPVFNAEVIIGSGLARAFTDAEGRYRIENLPPGYYHGTIRKPGYVSTGLHDSQIVELKSGENTVNREMRFAATGPVIRGTVINEQQQSIPGVTIRVLKPSASFAAWTGSSEAAQLRTEIAEQRRRDGVRPGRNEPLRGDAGGIFQIPDLPHGHQRIEASLPDGRTAVKTVHVDGNLELVFSEEDFLSTHVLTYTAGTGGQIEGTTPQTVTEGGNGSPVRAVAIPGYHFVGWSDGETNAERQHINVTQSITVTAEFAPNPSVTVTPTVPDGGGRVEVTGGNSHPSGSQVVFRAIADSGMVFSHWMHNGERVDGAGAVHTFAVSEGMDLAAHFKDVKGLPGVLMLLLEG